MSASLCQFPIKRFARDAQLSGKVLPGSFLRKVARPAEPAIEAFGYCPMRADLCAQPCCLHCMGQISRPDSGKPRRFVKPLAELGHQHDPQNRV